MWQAGLAIAVVSVALRGSSAAVVCSPLQNNTGIGEGDGCGSVKAASATACCAACVSNECCLAFTYARGTCYLKNSTRTLGRMDGRISGTVSRSAPPTPTPTVGPPRRLNLSVQSGVINEVSPFYASFSLDTSSNRGWFKRNITDPRLLRLASALSPSILRVGGTGNNCLRYNVPSTAPKSCVDDAVCCMNQSQWDNLNAFVGGANLSLVFGLRAQDGGNSSDTLSLLKYTADSGYPLLAFEFGNEVGCRTGSQLPELSSLLDSAWAAHSPAARPKIVGPDAIQFDILTPGATANCTEQFFNGSADTKVLGFTYHFYLQTHSVDYTADQLDNLARVAGPITASVRQRGAFTPTEVWSGEMGGHSGGGVLGVTDSFGSHQWYLDAMGLLATLGHSVFIRQDLVGGNYGLLQDNYPFGAWEPRAATPSVPTPGWQDDNGYNVLPDFWALLLWKKVMGTRVLRTEQGAGSDLGINQTTRTYAHCTLGVPGAATVLVINLDPGRPVEVALPPHSGVPTVYAMSPPGGNISSHVVLLNGDPLSVAADFTVPPVNGKDAPGLESIQVPPQCYSFVVLPGAAVADCP